MASVAFAAGMLLFRMLALRDALWSGLLALPAVWVTSEYLRNVTSPHGFGGKSCILATETSSASAACFDHGSVGMSFVLLLFSCCKLRLGCM
jgi:apolipoprotein N-acyltransferase